MNVSSSQYPNLKNTQSHQPIQIGQQSRRLFEDSNEVPGHRTSTASAARQCSLLSKWRGLGKAEQMGFLRFLLGVFHFGFKGWGVFSMPLHSYKFTSVVLIYLDLTFRDRRPSKKLITCTWFRSELVEILSEAFFIIEEGGGKNTFISQWFFLVCPPFPQVLYLHTRHRLETHSGRQCVKWKSGCCHMTLNRPSILYNNSCNTARVKCGNSWTCNYIHATSMQLNNCKKCRIHPHTSKIFKCIQMLHGLEMIGPAWCRKGECI